VKAVTAVTSTLKAGGSRFKADRQLTVRMLVTVFLLGLLYVAFIGALLVLLKSTLLVVVLAAGLLGSQYWFSDRIALYAMHGRIVTREAQPQLHGVIDRLCATADMPKPQVAIAGTDLPNAFATGRNADHAVLCVTTGLLRRLEPDELEGVLAHELAHIKNRDMLISTIAAGVAGAIGYLPYLLMFGGGRSDDREGGHPLMGIAALVIGPIAAMIIQYAVSRQREFEADRVGAEILGRPLPLANALKRLDAMSRQIPMQVQPAAAPLAQVNPLAANGGGLLKLFSTHPPTAERVARLEALAGGR
jgi:heat shock protein HtpX